MTNSPLCVCVCVCVCVLAIISNAAMKTGVYVFFQISVFLFFFQIHTRSGISGSCRSSIFRFLRNFHAVLFYFLCVSFLIDSFSSAFF